MYCEIIIVYWGLLFVVFDGNLYFFVLIFMNVYINNFLIFIKIYLNLLLMKKCFYE